MLKNVVTTFLLLTSAVALMGTSCVRYDVVLKNIAVPSCKDPLPEILSKLNNHDGSLIRKLAFPETDQCQNLAMISHARSSEQPHEAFIHWSNQDCNLTVAKMFNPRGCTKGNVEECERSKATGRKNLDALFEDLKTISPATFATSATDAGTTEAAQFIDDNCIKKDSGPPLDSSLSPWRYIKPKKDPVSP